MKKLFAILLTLLFIPAIVSATIFQVVPINGTITADTNGNSGFVYVIDQNGNVLFVVTNPGWVTGTVNVRMTDNVGYTGDLRLTGIQTNATAGVLGTAVMGTDYSSGSMVTSPSTIIPTGAGGGLYYIGNIEVDSAGNTLAGGKLLGGDRYKGFVQVDVLGNTMFGQYNPAYYVLVNPDGSQLGIDGNPIATTNTAMGTDATSGDYERVAIVGVPTAGIPVLLRGQEGYQKISITSVSDGTTALSFDSMDGGALPVIDAHCKYINNGIAYFLSHQSADIDSANGMYIAVYVPPGTTLHAYTLGNLNQDFSWVLYEDAVMDNTGTTITVFNRNRTSANTTNSEWYYDPITTTTGTEIPLGYVLAAAARNDYVDENKWILKSDSIYYWHLLPLADDDFGSFDVFFFEE